MEIGHFQKYTKKKATYAKFTKKKTLFTENGKNQKSDKKRKTGRN
jgi:hypothetical protein